MSIPIIFQLFLRSILEKHLLNIDKESEAIVMKLFQFNSIRANIAAAFVCTVLLITLILSIITYQLSLLSVRRTAADFTGELVKQVTENIQSYITTMEDISNLVLNHRDTILFLEEQNDQVQSIADFFNTILISRKDISSIALFDFNDRYIIPDQIALNPHIVIAEQSWYKSALQGNGQIMISSSHVQQIFNDDYRWVVSLSREIKDQEHNQSLGILLVDLNFNVINDIVSQIQLGKRGYIFIVDQTGKIVYHPQQQLIYSNLKTEEIEKILDTSSGSFISKVDGDNRMYTISESDFGWKIVGVSYENELIINKKQMQLSFFAIGLLSLIVAFFVAYIVARNLSKPIIQLQEHMKEVERGNFNISVPVDSTKEIGRLARTFNLMVIQIKELMSQVVTEQEFKRKRELEALQAQINPHFLYNTLDSIIWMAESDKKSEVISMTSALAKLFRASISKGQEFVSIQTEIEHITNYLTIQNIRYRDKLEYLIDIDPQILHYRSLKVILQPLVENAIYHGIKNQYGIGKIQIIGRLSEQNIEFKVIDNGVGISPVALAELTNFKKGERDGKGFGLVNVHERIQLYFGREYGVSIRSEEEVGTEVTITFAAIAVKDKE